MKNKTLIVAGLSLLVGLVIGWGFLARPPAPAEASVGAKPAEIWTCSMHPQIRKPQPGACPICGMDLIPVRTGEGSGEGPREITLSERALKLAEVETAPVERRFAEVELRLVGKIRFDEKRLAYIVARVPGRIDRLYASETGTRVRAGEHLADFYSPELISVQQELIQAARLAGETNGAGRMTGAAVLLEAARDKLRLWGFSVEQVAEIERSETLKDHLTFHAPIGGVVIAKEAVEGMAVDAGMRLFTVADLSSLWVVLDSYESDLSWLRYGQEVEFEVEAYPGETFRGMVAFIDPVLDALTRTVKVRVTTANPDGRLKPEMLVRAVVKARVGAGGAVSASHLEGQWTCTMHPEVLVAQAGPCPVCEMPLVLAVEVVTGEAKGSDEPPWLIPASAPLITGTRAVVYVQAPETPGRFEGRVIELGPRAGDYYVVRSGLREGERVVTRGNFKIDSSLQIQGKTSMMSEAEPSAAETSSAPVLSETARAQFRHGIDELVKLAEVLAADDFPRARQQAAAAGAALEQVDMTLWPAPVHEAWMKAMPEVARELREMAQAPDIEGLRKLFGSSQERIRPLIRALGAANVGTLYVLRCPMAFDNQGAIWLHRTPDVLNPYYGAAMLKCGAPVESYEGESPAQPSEHRHE